MSVGGIARRVTRLQHANVVRHPVAWSLSSSSSSSSLSFLPSSRSFTSTRSFATTPNADTVYDVAIIGCGAHGTSTAYHLAKKGKKVLGLERYELCHSNGSSHGETRITRLAYWEHPNYVPLLRRAFTLISELERDSGMRLFLRTGSLDIGPEKEATFQGSLLSCKTHGLEHQVLTPTELATRFPAWSVPSHYRACFQPSGGILFPEKTIGATVKLAREAGVSFAEQMEVTDLIPDENKQGVTIVTAQGTRYRARHIVLSPGAWLPTLLKKSTLGRSSSRLQRLAQMLKPERQVVSWYAASNPQCEKRFQPHEFPVFVATYKNSHYYGFPMSCDSTAHGVKVGRYHHRFENLSTEESLNNLSARQKVTRQDREMTDEFMSTMFGSNLLSGPRDEVLKMSTCMFTNTPDEHFLIDVAPDRQLLPQVSLISACSGHGFKFATVIGECMADMIVSGNAEAVEKKLPILWLDAGRLLGDKPPLQELNPHLEMSKKQI